MRSASSASRNVTHNEPFFTGHFPDFPVMPGVLIVEAMAQTAGVLVLKTVPDRDRKLVLLVAIENARFRRPVVPGDTFAHGDEGAQAQSQRRQNGGRRHRRWPGGGGSGSHVQARGQGGNAARGSVVLTMAIHPTAIVDPLARIAESAEIGPYCILGAEVEIGPRTRLMAHVYLEGPTSVGRGQPLLPL